MASALSAKPPPELFQFNQSQLPTLINRFFFDACHDNPSHEMGGARGIVSKVHNSAYEICSSLMHGRVTFAVTDWSRLDDQKTRALALVLLGFVRELKTVNSIREFAISAPGLPKDLNFAERFDPAFGTEFPRKSREDGKSWAGNYSTEVYEI